MQVFFVPNIVVSGEWKVVLQKEARSRCVVVEVVEPSLKTHSAVEEENLIREGLGALHDGNVLSKEFREEVFTTEIQQVNASLAQPQDDDSKLEKED
jgi:uncharacterized protein YhfF